MARISVVICCVNSADTIEAACQSVAWADELVVVDSGSSDATGQIAQKYADQYVVEPWRGYSRQKQFGTSLASNEWVLLLDGDEECSDELGRHLAAMSKKELEGYDLLLVRRRHYLMGRWVRAWRPDWQSRIYHRDRCQWGGEALHDSRRVSDPSRMRKLKTGLLLHKRTSDGGFKDYFNGQLEDSRLLMVAEEMYAKGGRCHWWDIVLRPWMASFKSLIIKGGILDGVWGILIAQKAAMGVQLKYAALWSVQQRTKKKADRD